MTTHDLGAIAAALQELPGVAAVVVHPDPSGGVDSLRLGLAPGVDGLEVAGAASRLVHERFGAVVQSDQVHVVDAPAPVMEAPARAEAVTAAPARPRGVRPEIVRTDMVTTGLEVTATVVLSAQSRSATGDARGAVTATGVQRAAAQATLRAVERLARDTARLEIEHLEVTSTGQHRTVLITLTLVSARGAEQLSGSALVREDECRAVVRATLDALNRRLETLLS